jgi:hypothetical protein
MSELDVYMKKCGFNRNGNMYSYYKTDKVIFNIEYKDAVKVMKDQRYLVELIIDNLTNAVKLSTERVLLVKLSQKLISDDFHL